MNVNHVLVAQAARLVHIKKQVYLPEIIAEIRQRYGFVRVPETADEILSPADDPRPLLFRHGKLQHGERMIVINNMSIFTAAISVQVVASTDDADVVVDDILRHGAELAEEADPLKLYLSQLEVVLGASLDRLSPLVDLIARGITGRLVEYGYRSAMPPFGADSLGMQFDPAVGATPAGHFRIERRERVPFDRNTYFSQAPLRTRDHIALLEEFDRALGS